MAIAVAFFLGIASFALVLTLFLQLGLGFTPAARRADVPALLGSACSSPRARPRGWRRGSGAGSPWPGRSSSPAGMAGLIGDRAPLRGGRDHLGAHARPARGRHRPGHGDRAAGRHRAGPGAEAGRGLGVRRVQHRPAARQLDRHRGDRSDLLRPARQPVRARGHRGRAAAADRARGRGRPGPRTPGGSRPSSAAACTTGWSPPTRRSRPRPAGQRARPGPCPRPPTRSSRRRAAARCEMPSPPRWSARSGSRSACSCSASCSCWRLPGRGRAAPGRGTEPRRLRRPSPGTRAAVRV